MNNTVGGMADAPLFDEMSRRRTDPKRYSEPTFTYYNESARPEFGQLRAMLELWYSTYPEVAKTDLRGRFRSPDDWQHEGAFFELYAHEMLRGMGFEVEPHPLAPTGDGACPDFLVRRSGKRCFYLECTVVPTADVERARQARMDQLYDTLNTHVGASDFFLSIELRGAPASPVPGRALARDLSTWLASLDWRKLSELADAGHWNTVPSFSWSHDGWGLVFQPIPKSENARDEPGLRPVGAIMTEMREVDDHTPVRNALIEKGRKYGQLDLPYVVAVNVLRDLFKDYDLMNALIGDQMTVVTRKGAGVSMRSDRRRNGVWTSGAGPRYTRMSGTLVGARLGPWTAAQRSPVLWHNPWAVRPLPVDLWPMSQQVPSNETGRFEERSGAHPSEFLRTPRPWPPEESDAVATDTPTTEDAS